MSGRKRRRGSKIGESFLALPRSVMESPQFIALPPHAVKLLIDLGAQYRGDNNGDLSAAWKLMKPRGWHSEATLAKAKRALLDAGFIFEARKGYRPNVCSLYALTWLDIDASPKHDGGPAAFTRGAYRFKAPLVAVCGGASKNAAPTTARGAAKAAQLQRA